MSYNPYPPNQQGYSQPAAPPPNSYGNPQTTPFGYNPNAPPTNMPPQYGQPPMQPPSYSGPPTTGGPPVYGAPPSTSAMPPPKSNVQFFSLASGTPTPSAAAPSVPPPPPSAASPDYGAPPVGLPPPPTGTNPVTANFIAGPPGLGGVPPGMQGYPPQPDYPGQLYGAPPPTSMVGMPTAFDSSSQLNQADGQSSGAQPLPGLDEMDLSIQCNPQFLRCTTGKLLNTQVAATASRIPVGAICRPMAGDHGTENSQIDVVDFGVTGIVRCKRCRTYINPFVSWVDNGRRWRCNICGMINEVPTSYFSHLDQHGQRRDKEQRPELSRCSVEFIAPGDYMVRPPQPPVYFFVIDVSAASVASGMLATCVRAIKDSLDDLPGIPRTQIGFMTFDTGVHFYNLKASLKAPQMLVVADITDLIMPSPDDLLANLADSRAVIDSLLESLPAMFQHTTSMGSCLGPALTAAKRVMQHIGGKLCLFQSGLPTIGEGALKPRENTRLIGTDKEHVMLNSEDPWYKNNAIDFSRLQIAIDVFLFSNQYTDVATLTVLAKYTSGSSFFYPGYFAPRDGQRFHSDLRHVLTRATGFEAVMRVRATRGIRITSFYGNYFIRGTDLLALPNCHSDTVFGLDLAYDEPVLSASAVTIQAALLYTTSSGERRIRVHTMVLPVTQSVPDLLETVDMDCVVNLVGKQGVEVALKSGLENARQRTHQLAVDILRAAKTPASPMLANPSYGYQAQAQMSAENAIPASLQLLPLYAMSLQKSLAIRGGADVRIDERAFCHQLVLNMDVPESIVFVYPRMFSLHNMGLDAGVPSDNPDDPVAGPDRIRLPMILNLSSERLTSDGIFLLENGHDMYMWIGRAVSPAILNTLFGVSTLDGVDLNSLSVQPNNSEYSGRVDAVLGALRSERSRYMQLSYIREGDGYAEAFFSRFLVEDRANFNGGTFSYVEYHTHVMRQVGSHPG